MGRMQVMGATTGDKEITWLPDKPKQVDKARKAFDEHIASGGKAFKVVVEQVTKRGKEIKKFDPAAERIILAAPVAGG